METRHPFRTGSLILSVLFVLLWSVCGFVLASALSAGWQSGLSTYLLYERITWGLYALSLLFTFLYVLSALLDPSIPGYLLLLSLAAAFFLFFSILPAILHFQVFFQNPAQLKDLLAEGGYRFLLSSARVSALIYLFLSLVGLIFFRSDQGNKPLEKKEEMPDPVETDDSVH